MINNGWLVLCLVAGSLLSVVLISSIPMYTDAIMQRMLIRDLEEFHVQRRIFPGSISARYNFYSPEEQPGREAFYSFITQNFGDELVPKLGLPILEQSRHTTLDYLLCIDTERPDENNKRNATQINALEGFEDHITILHGRMNNPEPIDGIYEVIVSEEAIIKLDLTLNNEYTIIDMLSEEARFKIKITGIYTAKDNGDLFWFRHLSSLSNSLILNYETFERDFISQYVSNLTNISWYFALNYREIKVENLPAIIALIEWYEEAAHDYRIEFKFPVTPMFQEYYKRAKVLNLMLLFLQIPVLLMLVFFIYMVSQLVINNERNEIAVLKSRGAGTSQIFNIYLTESIILGVAAFIVGPFAGFFVCNVLGSSNGFMEFVQRVALPVRLNFRTYLYAAAGLFLFVVTMLVPVVVFSRTTIVEHKRKKARSKQTSFWKKYFIDIILIALSLYGLYSYYSRQQILLITGIEGSALPVDPLLFIISILFILGTGLFALRLFPLIIKTLFSLGRKVWNPSTYAAFIHVGRSGGIQQFLMIFLILSLSIGVFNSTAARTINKNIEDKINYRIGAEITITPIWTDLSQTSGADGPVDPFAMPADAGPSGPPEWVEPPFRRYEELEGVEHVTKVLRNEKVSLRLPGGKTSTAEMMGIIPNEFAEVAWFRRDLLASHWINYLNLMTSAPTAILASRSLQEEHGLQQGDSVLISWAGQGSIEGIVYAFIDYWPGINPVSSSQRNIKKFIIANLNYIHAKMTIEPYETWINKKDDVASQIIFQDIENKKIEIKSLSDTKQEIIKEKNDPMLQGTNGVLTLGFLVSMAICIAGFVIYWILSLQGRVLQFGIIRAMGLEKRKLSWMLIWEHFLISGIAIVLGIVIGQIASKLFIPLIQIIYASTEQVPPFKIVMLPQDLLQIYIIAILIILIGIVLFRVMVSRLNIHQALKLGEE